MQQAVSPGEGSMAVVLGLEMDAVRSLCEETSAAEVVAPANYNGGGQVVIAGGKNAVARAMSLAKERRAKKVLELPVSAPFHCEWTRPAAQGLKKILDGVKLHPYSIGLVTHRQSEVNPDPASLK